MPFFTSTPPDPNVNYAGRVLPAQRGASHISAADPNTPYDGYVLPGQKAPVKQQASDPNNNPGYVVIGGITLPPDTLIHIENKKTIARTMILDGVEVFERVTRMAAEIEFDCVLRMQTVNGVPYYNTTPPSGFGGTVYNIFAQAYLDDAWTQIWAPNTVQQVTNTMLNGLSITQIVIESVNVATVRGSTNVPIKIKALENVYGLPINMNPGETNYYQGIL